MYIILCKGREIRVKKSWGLTYFKVRDIIPRENIVIYEMSEKVVLLYIF